MDRRSFLQRAAGAVVLTLATVYTPSLKAVAVVTRAPVARKGGYWLTLKGPSDLAKRIFVERAHDMFADTDHNTISGLFYGGTRELHRDIRNEFSFWYASPARPPRGAISPTSA